MGRARVPCRAARDLSWPPEIWICVARSLTTCPPCPRDEPYSAVTSLDQSKAPPQPARALQDPGKARASEHPAPTKATHPPGPAPPSRPWQRRRGWHLPWRLGARRGPTTGASGGHGRRPGPLRPQQLPRQCRHPATSARLAAATCRRRHRRGHVDWGCRFAVGGLAPATRMTRMTRTARMARTTLREHARLALARGRRAQP